MLEKEKLCRQFNNQVTIAAAPMASRTYVNNSWTVYRRFSSFRSLGDHLGNTVGVVGGADSAGGGLPGCPHMTDEMLMGSDDQVRVTFAHWSARARHVTSLTWQASRGSVSAWGALVVLHVYPLLVSFEWCDVYLLFASFGWCAPWFVVCQCETRDPLGVECSLQCA